MRVARRTFVAALGAVGCEEPGRTPVGAEAPEVVKLERVVVSGVRTPDPTVAQLPRVVIEGRRNQAGDGTQVASACVAPQVC